MMLIEPSRITALHSALRVLTPCPFAGTITADQAAHELGEVADIWPSSIIADAIELARDDLRNDVPEYEAVRGTYIPRDEWRELCAALAKIANDGRGDKQVTAATLGLIGGVWCPNETAQWLLKESRSGNIEV